MSQPTMYVLEMMWRDIEKRFMPLVFSCGCKGSEETCARALADGRTWERREAVLQIGSYIRRVMQQQAEGRTMDQIINAADVKKVIW